jgi:peptidoglycan/xylan/chitin deacetylase (PgdA/CDA1 family)
VATGVEIGAHSVTHIRLAAVSALRRQFEIAESKRLCERLAGRCEAFAHPYGTADVHSAATRAELQVAGFSVAFLSHSDFITTRTDAMSLPRFAMPDEPITLAEFRVRASGGGIVVRRLKELLYGGRVSRGLDANSASL